MGQHQTSSASTIKTVLISYESIFNIDAMQIRSGGVSIPKDSRAITWVKKKTGATTGGAAPSCIVLSSGYSVVKYGKPDLDYFLNPLTTTLRGLSTRSYLFRHSVPWLALEGRVGLR